jgi:hypothetical protein
VAEEWDQTTKGEITREYFPVVADRLKMKINVTQNFTTMVMGHGSVRSCLHRFKIIESPICPCGTTEQTVNHILVECELLNKERNNLISAVLKTDIWPITKNKLIRNILKYLPNSPMKYHLTNSTKYKIYHTEQSKLTLQYVIICVTVFKTIYVL